MRVNILAKSALPPEDGRNSQKSEKQGRDKAFLLFSSEKQVINKEWEGEILRMMAKMFSLGGLLVGPVSELSGVYIYSFYKKVVYKKVGLQKPTK